MKYTKTLGIIIFILIVFEIVICSYLVYDYSAGKSICLKGNSCDSVKETVYGYVFGIRIGYIALVAFISLLIVYPLKKSRYFLTATLVGSLFAVFLILVQIFILHEICTTCMLIDFIMVIIFILALVGRYIHHRRQKLRS